MLGPRVQREMTLGDHRDARHAVGGELVDEHLDERDPARRRGVAQRPLGDFDRIEVRRTPELADRVASDSAVVHVVTSVVSPPVPKCGR